MESMNYELVGMIANLGFPIVISIYLLVRLENRMENWRAAAASSEELSRSHSGSKKRIAFIG